MLYCEPGAGQIDDLSMRLTRHVQFLQSDSSFLSYHFVLMRLLGQACVGKSQGPELRVQSMFPTEHMVTVAISSEGSLLQRTAFSELLYHTILDAETYARRLDSTLRGSGALSFYQSELERLSVCRSLSPEQQKYLLEGVLPCLVGILKILDSSRIDNDTRNAAGKHVLELAEKLSGQLSEAQVNAFHDHVDAISVVGSSIMGELDCLLLPRDEPGRNSQKEALQSFCI